jgi:enoyl-CoA hydratase/carnithine racemase
MADVAVDGRITVHIADGVASVQLDNPERRNAITKQMCQEIQLLLPRLDRDREVRVVTLRGAGDTFSAGAAIDDLASVLLDPQRDGSTVDQLSLADAAIVAMQKPVIAIVDGVCMGGGWQLASACDFIVASERSVVAITPAKIGVIYPRAGIERLLRQVGPANAKFILFGGETFTALRARQLGLITEVVPDGKFEDRVGELVHTLLDRSRFSIHTLKRLIDIDPGPDHEIDELWNEAWAAMTQSPDMAIGVAAFLNRERPRFAWEPSLPQ